MPRNLPSKSRWTATTLVGLATVVASIAVTAGPVFAADKKACVPGKTKKIAFLMKQSTAYRYLHADMPFFVKTAEAAGYKVITQSAENDALNQVSQAENVLTQGVDVIVINPVDFHVAAAIAKKAAAAGVPLASYNDLILGAKHDAFIGRDNREGGVVAANAMIKKVPKGNYALIGGDPGQTGATEMQQGYHAVLDKLVKAGQIKIVLDQLAKGWKTEPAQAFAENALTLTNNKVDAFLVSYDGESLGVMQAIKGAGLKPGSIPVTGQDMELAAIQAIIEGRMFGSVWPAPDKMGESGAKAAIALARCQDIGANDTINNGAAKLPWVKTPIYFVGANDIADFICQHPYWVDINEAYKNAPGKKPKCAARP
ncbi:MAG TPA: substrate-binding domain-containing protein [Polyangia bacterium]|nr:substrate-binding domain-containing protein [Polyangia bacterium]